MRREALLGLLVEDGALSDPAWRAAFSAVPRELFVPSYVVASRGGEELRRRDDPDPRARARWLDGCYEDVPLATRLHHGRLLSSSSQPSLMARMLAALEVRDGMSVLEIGTGTGWNAALLCHRLGAELVTTVDLEPELTDAARRNLAALGLRPTVVTGDGALGHPPKAPYDRIIATCALPALPSAWIAQSAPDGLILAPLATGLVALRVRRAGPGGWAEGRFLDTPAFFVPLRSPGRPEGRPAEASRPGGVPGLAAGHGSFRFLLELSAGRLDPQEAYELWRQEGRPGRERYGLTVTPEGQWAWLDAPDGAWRWRLPDPAGPG